MRAAGIKKSAAGIDQKSDTNITAARVSLWRQMSMAVILIFVQSNEE